MIETQQCACFLYVQAPNFPAKLFADNIYTYSNLLLFNISYRYTVNF